MKTILKVETKYNENLADAQVLVVTLLSNNNRNWDFIVDTDAYNSLIINDYYYVTTQENWIGIIVGIRLETIAKAMHLKATVLESVRDPHDDDQVEVLDEEEDDTEADDQLDIEYKWLMLDKAAPLKAVHCLWEYKYAGKTSNVVNVRSSILDLLLLKRFAEDKLSEISELSDKEVYAYNKFHENNAYFPMINPYDDMLRVLYKGNKEKNEK